MVISSGSGLPKQAGGLSATSVYVQVATPGNARMKLDHRCTN